MVSYGPLAFGLLTGAITRRDGLRRRRLARRRRAADPDDPDEVDLFAPDVLPTVLELVERLRPIAERARRHAPPARARVERASAGGHERDRGQPQPRARALERRGRRPDARRRHARRARRTARARPSVGDRGADPPRVRPSDRPGGARRTMPSSSFSVTCGSSSSSAIRCRRNSRSTRSGVTATTEALRGCASIAASSPKKSPGTTAPTFFPPRTTLPSPSSTTNRVSPGSPSRTTASPGANVSSSVSAARRCRCRFEKSANSGTPASAVADRRFVRAIGCSGRRGGRRARGLAPPQVRKALTHALQGTYARAQSLGRTSARGRSAVSRR